MNTLKKIFKVMLDFIKNETVLAAAAVLAVISAFIVRPDKRYIDYLDFRTLAILFCLMAVMALLKEQGVFDVLAVRLLKRVRSFRSTLIILWGMCFFLSMLITNDVALITFVPFMIILLNLMGNDIKKKWLVPAAVMQTIAANMGSMLTPLGNPQNLYLYSKSSMSLWEFILNMLPYTLISLVLLIIWSFAICRKNTEKPDIKLPDSKLNCGKIQLSAALMLFMLCLLTVARIIPYPIVLIIITAYLLVFERKILLKVDYSLLLTFAGFFIFIGNIGRIDAFKSFLEKIISGREILTAALSSQVISNVPAALLLSGFTENYKQLTIGVNIGGLGTLIASMASLISFKLIAREDSSLKLKYLIFFTISNIVFIAFMSAAVILIC